MTAFPTLFSPVRIGPVELRNRLVMSPMETLYGTPEGLPSARTIAYFEARARGGVGLITLGASSIDAQHKEVPNSLHFASDDVVDAHRALTDRVHEHGAKIQPQLAHAGPDGLAPEMHGIASVGPSEIQSYLTGATSRALGAEELAAIVDLYRAAAARVRDAGYDGIELHAAHGYMLLGSFLSPWRNARRDDYAARTREGRVRAVAEVVRAIKREVGREFPLTLRVSGFERVSGGRPSDDTARIAPALVAAGVDAFHVSGGVIDRFVTQMVNGSHERDALNVAAAASVKRAVDVPVMVVGRIHTPELAERVLDEGSADLVVMGRPMLADAEFASKASSGRAAEIRRCISCQNCIDSMEQRFAMDCAVSPTTGRELELTAPPATIRRRVLVIGGGPAGLEAARIAARRGHEVSLHERRGWLGGALVAAATVHPENAPLLGHLTAEVSRLPIRIELGSSLAAADVGAVAPDVVIVATGGRVVLPAIPGDDLPHVVTGARLNELLDGALPAGSGGPWWQRAGALAARSPLRAFVGPHLLRRTLRRWLPFGDRVVVIGGDLAAIELAEFLAETGRQVSIIEPGDTIAPEVGDKRRGEHMIRLDRLGVPINTGVPVDRITRTAVVLRQAAGAAAEVPADSVVIAGSVEADTALYDSVASIVPEAHAIGDCTGLGLLRGATMDAATVADVL